MTGSRREQVYAFVCQFIHAEGYSPSLEEIGTHLGITPVGAWKHVTTLIGEGRLFRSRDRDRYLLLPGRVDLRPVPTNVLVAELGRRRAVSHAQRALS
jgi:biotin operon repressor